MGLLQDTQHSSRCRPLKPEQQPEAKSGFLGDKSSSCSLPAVPEVWHSVTPQGNAHHGAGLLQLRAAQLTGDVTAQTQTPSNTHILHHRQENLTSVQQHKGLGNRKKKYKFICRAL